MLPRSTLRSELLAALWQTRNARLPRARGVDRRGQIPHMTPIAERPAEVATSAVPSPLGRRRFHHGGSQWLCGWYAGGANVTAGHPGTDGGDGCGICPRGLQPETPARACPSAQNVDVRSGEEMAEYKQLAQRLAIRIFVADPYSPWQRGTNEHTNGLLQRYVPKGTDLSGYRQCELNAIAHRLTTRPRTCPNFAMPLEVSAHLRHHSLTLCTWNVNRHLQVPEGCA